MEALLLKLEDMYDRLSKAYTNYKKSPKDRKTVQYIESRLETLENLLEKFEDSHYQLVTTIKKEEKIITAYFINDEYGKFEETYLEYKVKMKEDLEKLRPVTVPVPVETWNSSIAPTEAKSEVKLPQINLPKFTGSYEEWQSFYDMFKSLIHRNSSLNAVQKLHYLKSSLSGEPENLLKNLPTTAANYEEAWNQLTRRYNNKRFNCNEILKRLFAQRNLTSESATSIKQLLDTTSACLKSLNNMSVTTDSWDPMINHLVVSKLDVESRKTWELQMSQIESEDLPTWNQLVTFLEKRFRTLEMIDGGKLQKPVTNSSTNKAAPSKKSFHASVQDEKKKVQCVKCPEHHLLYVCPQFLSQSPNERSEFIQSKKLCFNCFSSNHSVKNCKKSTTCRRCGRRHHTLLHFERDQAQEKAPATSSEKPVPGEPPAASSNQADARVTAHFAQGINSEVLLATARVKAVALNGLSKVVRALIDQGSEASFVTEATVQSLGLKRIPVNGLISGVGEGQMRSKYMVSLELESLLNPEFSIKVSAFVLKSLTSFLPTSKTYIENWPDFESLNLADPHYGSPERIDIILGVEVHSEIILSGLLKHPCNSGPIAQNTQFGWVLTGRVTGDTSSKSRMVSLHVRVKEDDLLRKFWEIEREPDSIKKKMTSEENKCEEIYSETTERDESGRYIVHLPFKNADPDCLYSQSQIIARRRFQLLEKRLLRNPSLYEDYKLVMQDYIDQNHMVQITDTEDINNPRVVYLPHHAVVRQDKETSKVRVVFDASSKGTNHVSLNDCLLVGPKLQQDLRHTLMRWRRHPYCMAADLVQMYRQILVRPEDTNCQRILWRSQPDHPIQHYRLLRLTFGTACAPYLAVKSLQQLAMDESSKYPLAATITLEDFYMDDLLSGSDSEDRIIEIYNQMNELMNAGGFCLRKWCTNSDKLLNHIQTESRGTEPTVVLKTDDSVKILGICWSKSSDEFNYTYQLPEEVKESATKRMVLSEVARLYDPLGWIAPVIIKAKLFIQQLWKSGLGWDQELTSELAREWNVFKQDLANVNEIKIPRWLNTKREAHVELHAFADASQVAYAGVVYLRTTDVSGKVQVTLVAAKTKVAPIEKEISIPRMELCAAVLATKLLFEVSQIMAIPKQHLFAWSDSTVVLAWLRAEPSRWTTFVSNRVSEILTILDRDQWSHVRTDQNPADCGSRGMTALALKSYNLWWYGPLFLTQGDKYTTSEIFVTNEEQRPIKLLTAAIQKKEDFIWNRFSDLQRGLRVLSYCKRFLNLKLPKEEREISQTVTQKELTDVMEFCIKETQSFFFAEELQQLKSQGFVAKRSALHTLSAFLDEKGILRVGGRINQAESHFNKKHPMIMPGESHFTKLLVLDAHTRTLHGGPQIMLNFLRSKFWIIRGRNLVKKCYRECMTCLRYSRQTNNQYMGQLPKARVTPTRPFKSAGVDFTGHINIRFSPGRGSKAYKGYVCVFVCMVTKAIHLEAVSNLTAQGFIAAFRRFVARRGHCQDLYSDNGTNFVGADKEMRDMLQRAVSKFPSEVGQLLSKEGTTWHFIPPQAPNFGGLWEAGVRSTKSHLKRVIGDATLTFEELSTVLTQIEACLNSRPLYCLSDNPNDPLPLTPGHFLVGEPLVAIPDEDHSEVNATGQQRWKLVQKMVSDFWKRWSIEYLVHLNQRYKWFTKKSEPEVGDIVIIKDLNMPPSKWLLGKIIEKHPGKDNITRVVTVKTKSGICKRPCNKLCLLPKDSETQ